MAWLTKVTRLVSCALTLVGGVGVAACAVAQQPLPDRESKPAVSPKIAFDVSAISPAGLSGAADGAVAVSYEFCIPANPAAIIEVERVDPSARCTLGSRGRIGCAPDEALCIGSTNQAGWLGVLNAVAALSYVKRITRSFGE